MKKIALTIGIIVFLTSTTTAQTSALFRNQLIKENCIEQNAKEIECQQALSQETQPCSPVWKLARTEAITEQPTGVVFDSLYRFSACYEASSLGKGVFSLSDGVVSTIVEGDDGYLYLKDPFSRFAYGSWIKGKLEGDTVTFEFPQFMYSEQSGGFTLDCYASRMILNDDASSFILDPERQDMKFLWKHGQLTQLEDTPVLGMSTWIPELGNMWFWVGYADYSIHIEPLRNKVIDLPRGLATETYTLNYWPDDDTEDYRMVQVAIDGQDIFLNNLSNTNPQAWILGSFDGQDARFFSDDYLGISYRMNGYDPDQHIFSMTAREVKTYAESGSYQSEYYPTHSIDFHLNTSTGIFASDSVLAANAGTRRVYAETIFRQPSLRKFTEVAGTPRDPSFVAVSEYSPTSGYGLMTITMPKLTTNGQRMNLDKLFYRIYLDNELMTFYPDEYWYVTEPTIDMPYSHVDKRDFNIDVDMHRIFYYQSGFDRIGIEMVYRGGNEEHHSNIIYYDLETGESSIGGGDAVSTQWGTRKAETYDVAIRLDGNMYAGKSIEQLRIPLADAAPIKSMKGFLTTELTLVDGENKADIITLNATPVGPSSQDDYGWTEITLPQPYTIPAEGIYVGYTLDIDDVSTLAGKRPIITTATTNNKDLYVHTSRTYRRWQSIGKEFGQTLAMEIVLGGLTENAASLSDIGEISTQTDVTTPVTLYLHNHGSNPIASIDLSYSVAGISNRQHYVFSQPLPAHYDEPQPFSITLPAISESNVYQLTIRIDQVNGIDNSDLHQEVTGKLLVFGLLPKHRALVEEYTGTWCGNCPRGMVAMEEMKHRYPDDFIGVSYHNSDGMEVTTSFPSPIDAYPNAMIDRTILTDPYYGETQNHFGLEALWQRQSEVAAPAAISVTAEWADDNQSSIRATSSVTFQLSSQPTLRVAYLLLADNLSGSGRGWTQVNYFQNTSGWELEGMQPFVDGAYYVTGLKYNDVMIAHSAWTGVAGSLPESVEGNVPVNHTYEFSSVGSVRSLSGDELMQDKQNLRVVALLVDPETGIVVNANKAPVATSSGITSHTHQEKEMIRAIYSPDGKRIAKPRHGLNILRFADGRTEKVIR